MKGVSFFGDLTGLSWNVKRLILNIKGLNWDMKVLSWNMKGWINPLTAAIRESG